MTMEQAVRARAAIELAHTLGAARAVELAESAEVHALPRVVVAEVEDRVLVELRETEDSPLSWVLMLTEEQSRALAN
ncbi:MAG: hypothetical protein M0Z66_16000 [Thermaerobacter sp.]|nr:hypothetical protein [Thermaerobacter sp.]